MKLEIKSEEILDWFVSHEIPLDKTRTYLSDSLPTQRRLIDPFGAYIPRDYEAYVLSSRYLKESLERYVHEISHGAFVENFPLGKRIADLDRKIFQKEIELFGTTSLENVTVITSRKVEKSRKINESKFEVNKSHFLEYKGLSDVLGSIISNFLHIIEGFSLILTEEILGKVINNSLPNVYLVGYAQLSVTKREGGLEELISQLYELKWEEVKKV